MCRGRLTSVCAPMKRTVLGGIGVRHERLAQTCCLILFVLLAHVVQAQTPISDTKRELIKELVAVMQADQTAQKTLDAAMAQMVTQYPKMLADLLESRKDMTPEQKERIVRQETRSRERFWARFRERLGDIYASQELFDRVYFPAYSKYFTEGELRDLLAFYKSPTGHKVLQVQPELTSDVLKSVFDLLGPTIKKLVQELFEEELEKLKNETQLGSSEALGYLM